RQPPAPLPGAVAAVALLARRRVPEALARLRQAHAGFLRPQPRPGAGQRLRLDSAAPLAVHALGQLDAAGAARRRPGALGRNLRRLPPPVAGAAAARGGDAAGAGPATAR